jgi:hypothetical protein
LDLAIKKLAFSYQQLGSKISLGRPSGIFDQKTIFPEPNTKMQLKFLRPPMVEQCLAKGQLPFDPL